MPIAVPMAAAITSRLYPGTLNSPMVSFPYTIDVVQRARIGAPDEAEHVLEHEHDRERQQQLEALVAIVDGAKKALDERAHRGHCRAGEQQQRQQQDGGIPACCAYITAVMPK